MLRRSRWKRIWTGSSPSSPLGDSSVVGRVKEFKKIQEAIKPGVTKEETNITCFDVPDEDAGQRIDLFLAERMENLSRSRIQGLIRDGLVKVNGRATKSSYTVRVGDRISTEDPPPEASVLRPEPVSFETIYEDPFLVVLNKPSGIVVHPAPGHSGGTLVHGLLRYCDDLSGIGGVVRPGIVHRLDKDTSGVMVIAKNDRVHVLLSQQFKARKVRKSYLALVHGIPEVGRGEIDLPIARHPKRRKEMAVQRAGGKRAITNWEKLSEVGSNFCLLAVSPKTGRTHQIRVHLSHFGHPVVGDKVYGYRQQWWRRNFPGNREIAEMVNRQMLHAAVLGFIHPGSGKYCEFEAPMPEDMKHLIETLGG
ncbi:MAG: RluA family pseudouridine synthase [Deltaproteobacteria bacterium]|nr:RluA family pseudouridine synthase [Deltaproteobacteria bacterium]